MITRERINCLRNLHKTTGGLAERWSAAKGGRSVNAGSYGKIRIEPGLPPNQVTAMVSLIVNVHDALPDLLDAAEGFLDDEQLAEESEKVPVRQESTP